MTPEIMWSLLVALGAIAVGAVLHAAESARKLHLADKELTSTREQLNSLKKEYQKRISDLEKMHLAEKEYLSKQLSLQSEPVPHIPSYGVLDPEVGF